MRHVHRNLFLLRLRASVVERFSPRVRASRKDEPVLTEGACVCCRGNLIEGSCVRSGGILIEGARVGDDQLPYIYIYLCVIGEF